MALTDELTTAADKWIAEDPDPRTRQELTDLLATARAGDAEAAEELADRFSGPLQFGTAGLRGEIAAGPHRMNRVVVTRAAAGLAEYLRTHGGTSIVIGYDARRNSDVFARDTAEIMAGVGIAAKLLPEPLPTPVTAFAIRYLGVDAAVMVTASHNPPNDNGYKVYLGDGSQIVPPADADISACIAAVGPIADLPRSDDYEVLDGSVRRAYLDRAVSLLDPATARDVKIVYTAMHGVGGLIQVEALVEGGFPEPVRVKQQFDPDPRFPTVPFPNPEEPGALDLSFAAARAAGADLIIANDPDADRCAAAIPDRDGEWRRLTGDEVGALLGWWKAERARRAGQTLSGAYAASVVSCSLIRKIADAAGLDFQMTLTGFKWISRVPDLVFGYEEALGYCVDSRAVRDKDGISACLLLSEMTATLIAEGRHIPEVLDDLAVAHGLHVTKQIAIRVEDPQVIADAMARLRSEPPTSLGGTPVVDTADLSAGWHGLPPTDGLRFAMESGRVVVRPSGTEPKLKCYVETVVPVGTVAEVAAGRALADERIEAIGKSLMAAIVQG